MGTSREQYAELVERELRLAFPQESSAAGDEIVALVVRGQHRGFDTALFLNVAEPLFRATEFILLVISVTLHARDIQHKTSVTREPEDLRREYAELKKKFPDLPDLRMDEIIERIQSDTELRAAAGISDIGSDNRQQP